MTLPVLTIKYWLGNSGEYFTYGDMTRVNSNANVIATECGISTVSFAAVTRASQFDYSEFQALENLIDAIATECGTDYTPETSWGVKRVVSYVDFERVELGLYLSYISLGGQGERVGPTETVTIERHTLKADEWSGTFPKYQDLTIMTLYEATDSIVIPGYMNSDAWHRAMWAQLRPYIVGDQQLRIYADGVIPSVDIDIIIATEVLSMQAEITLTASGWVGTGPWTQNKTVTGVGTATVGILGTGSTTSVSQNSAFIQALPHITEVSANTITVTATGIKPTIDIPCIVTYENDAISE